MSENLQPFSLKAAQKYNSKVDYALLPEMLDAVPALRTRRDGPRFATGVYEFQRSQGLSPYACDGKLGRQTYALLVEFIGDVYEHVMMNGTPLPLPEREGYKLITFEEHDGLDLHRFGHFSPRKTEIKGVCLHWGGLDAQHCFNVFASPARKVSSHFLIGLVDGKPVIYQVLDLKHAAWHGGKINSYSIGIDICQQAGVQWADHYAEHGYDLSVIDNPSSRGERKVLSLHPALRHATALFVKDLLNALGLPFNPAPDANGIFEDEVEAGEITLYGHSHVNRRKWDIAPYWDDIMDELGVRSQV